MRGKLHHYLYVQITLAARTGNRNALALYAEHLAVRRTRRNLERNAAVIQRRNRNVGSQQGLGKADRNGTIEVRVTALKAAV